MFLIFFNDFLQWIKLTAVNQKKNVRIYQNSITTNKGVLMFMTEKRTTMLTKPIFINLSKCYIGNNIKKGLETCIGAGCKDLKVNLPKVVALNNNLTTTKANDNVTCTKVSTQENVSSNIQENQKTSFDSLKKQHKWLSDSVKVEGEKDSTSNTEEIVPIPKKDDTYGITTVDNQKPQSVLTSKIKENALQEILDIGNKNKLKPMSEVSNPVTTKEGAIIPCIESNSFVKDDVGIPVTVYEIIKPSVMSIDIPEIALSFGTDHNGNMYQIPAPPPMPLISKSSLPLPEKAKGNMLDQLLGLKMQAENSNIKSSEVKQRLKALEERGLVIYENEQEKLTKEFYKLPKVKVKTLETIKVELTEDTIKNNNFNIGILQVADIQNVILLEGIQTHVVVIYKIQDNQRIVIGFLTSDKDAQIVLSETQPFDFEHKHKNKIHDDENKDK